MLFWLLYEFSASKRGKTCPISKCYIERERGRERGREREGNKQLSIFSVSIYKKNISFLGKCLCDNGDKTKGGPNEGSKYHKINKYTRKGIHKISHSFKLIISILRQSSLMEALDT